MVEGLKLLKVSFQINLKMKTFYLQLIYEILIFGVMEENHLTESQLLGRDGEQIAADYLVSAGYKIIERNWVCGRYEIDIICTKEQGCC